MANSRQCAHPQHDAALHSAAATCFSTFLTQKYSARSLTSMKAFEVISGSDPFPAAAAADAGKTAEEQTAAATAAPALTSPDRVKPVSLLVVSSSAALLLPLLLLLL